MSYELSPFSFSECSFTGTVKDSGSGPAHLHCPNCGGDNLHLVSVPLVDTREESVVLEFICESCDASPQLVLQGHKGCSYLAWRRISEAQS